MYMTRYTEPAAVGYLIAEYVRCGKPGCRCRRGARHGPYWYLHYRRFENGRWRGRKRRTYSIDSIRHHPPSNGGGRKSCWSLSLATKRHCGMDIASGIRQWQRLRCGVLCFGQEIAPAPIHVVDTYQLLVYNGNDMLMKLIRDEIRTCGKSRYVISKETGIDKAALCRIMQGKSCIAETLDILLDYFGLTIVKKKDRKAR